VDRIFGERGDSDPPRRSLIQSIKRNQIWCFYRTSREQVEVVRDELQTKRPYAARAFDLFKNTAKEWSEDKCPQLGAALAYYTVFSLAPMVLVLLAVFGWIFGSSEQAREKITDQLRYFIDPSGVKVIQDIRCSCGRAQRRNSGRCDRNHNRPVRCERGVWSTTRCVKYHLGR
jgi:hypothetical protein